MANRRPLDSRANSSRALWPKKSLDSAKTSKLLIAVTIISCLAANSRLTFARQILTNAEPWRYGQDLYSTSNDNNNNNDDDQELQQFADLVSRLPYSTSGFSDKLAAEDPAGEKGNNLILKLEPFATKRGDQIYSNQQTPIVDYFYRPTSYLADSSYSTLSEPLDLNSRKLLDLLSRYDEGKQHQYAEIDDSDSAYNNRIENFPPIEQSLFYALPVSEEVDELSKAPSSLNSDSRDNKLSSETTHTPRKPKYSTLLDDDDDDDDKGARTIENVENETTTSTSTTTAAAATATPSPTTSTPAPTTSTTTASYGSVVLAPERTTSGWTSAHQAKSYLGDLYKRLAAIWPFVSQADKEDKQKVANNGTSLEDNGSTKDSSSKEEKRDSSILKSSKQVAKQSVSNKVAKTNEENSTLAQASSLVHEVSAEPEAAVKNNDQSNVDQLESTRSMDQVSIRPARNNNNNNNRVSLLRSSSVVLPVKTNDELILHETSSSEGLPSAATASDSDNLLGRYIFAPGHHFHLNSISPLTSDKKSLNGNRAYTRRLLEEDDLDDVDRRHGMEINPYRSSYNRYMSSAMHGGPESKTNDLYFLVIVAAFCVMAMAVVLAAGLFAYRVQQNRKLNTEPDYPTYGVVGPNNMANKCNASAFVGGYFNNNNTDPMNNNGFLSSAAAANNKLGASSGGKHLHADLYSVSDSGLASSKSSSSGRAGHDHHHSLQTAKGNSGSAAVAATNYLANQDAARMYHYQHQKQQMIINDRATVGRHTSASDLDSEDENDDGSYTVYECPGLASAHEMEIKNPLFNDDQTP